MQRIRKSPVLVIFIIVTVLPGCDGNSAKASLRSLTIMPPNFALSSQKAELQFTAIGRYSDGTEKDVTAEVTWSSSDTSVVTITGTGLAKATAPAIAGSVEVNASLDSISGRTALTVVDAEFPPDDRASSPPRLQIMNCSSNIYRLKIGDVIYANPSYCICGSNCTAGFFDVAEGDSSLIIYRTSTSAGEMAGELGPFLNGNHYTLTIEVIDGWCARLWQRGQMALKLLDDSTRMLIHQTEGCFRGV